MRNLPTTCVLLALTSACAVRADAGPQAGPGDTVPVRVEHPDDGPGIVDFADGRSFETGLMRPTYWGQLPAAGRGPYLVLAGYGCDDCDINLSMYVHSPADGPIRGESQPRFGYPGALIEWETDVPGGELIHRIRAFVGECLRDGAPVAVWFTEAPAAEGEWERSADALHVRGDSLAWLRIGDSARALRDAERQTGRGRCREIPPKEQLREP